MAMDDTESCSSRAVESSPTHGQPQHRHKLEVFAEVLRRLKESGHEDINLPGFEDELWNHFNRLPPRYALDVNVERAEDVLNHKRLLHLAKDPAKRPVFDVRLVQVLTPGDGKAGCTPQSPPEEEDGQDSSSCMIRHSIHPPPAFGSSPNLEALALEGNKCKGDDDSTVNGNCLLFRPMHEVTFSTDDKPKLLSQLTSLLAEIGLNIQEAHAFSTTDGYSLDVFVVDGWEYELINPAAFLGERGILMVACGFLDNMSRKSTSICSKLEKDLPNRCQLLVLVNLLLNAMYPPVEDNQGKRPMKENDKLELNHGGETQRLREAIGKEIAKIEKQAWSKPQALPILTEQADELPVFDHVKIPNDGTDVWEIDLRLLKFEKKIASGSYGDLYRGTYCSQDVAIKILKPERVDVDMQREFAQEVFIMRKVRHKNVVQFIGACTKPPTLCIVTEFMHGGSVYDFLHKQKGVFKLPALLRVAIDVSKGMNYLHQNNIIHRDLKAANLLMDENEVVKVADFGVARVQAQSGVMTAETGTYRWMAPEVIEHKPYDRKADVFSFAIVLWELLTGKLPYDYLTPLQAAVGVVQKGLRPTIPKNVHPKLAELLEKCWQQDPTLRLDFSEIIESLQKIAKEVGCEGEDRRKEKSTGGGFLSAFRRTAAGGH